MNTLEAKQELFDNKIKSQTTTMLKVMIFSVVGKVDKASTELVKHCMAELKTRLSSKDFNEFVVNSK